MLVKLKLKKQIKNETYWKIIRDILTEIETNEGTSPIGYISQFEKIDFKSHYILYNDHLEEIFKDFYKKDIKSIDTFFKKDSYFSPSGEIYRYMINISNHAKNVWINDKNNGFNYIYNLYYFYNVILYRYINELPVATTHKIFKYLYHIIRDDLQLKLTDDYKNFPREYALSKDNELIKEFVLHMEECNPLIKFFLETKEGLEKIKLSYILSNENEIISTYIKLRYSQKEIEELFDRVHDEQKFHFHTYLNFIYNKIGFSKKFFLRHIKDKDFNWNNLTFTSFSSYTQYKYKSTYIKWDFVETYKKYIPDANLLEMLTWRSQPSIRLRKIISNELRLRIKKGNCDVTYEEIDEYNERFLKWRRFKRNHTI